MRIMRDHFVRMGIFTEEEAGKIQSDHAAFKEASEQLACTLEEEYEKLYQAVCEAEARELELLKTLGTLVLSPACLGMQDNVMFRERLESGLKEIGDGVYPVLACAEALEHAVNLLTGLQNEYEAARENNSKEVKESVGEALWNEFSEELESCDFFNKVCYFKSGEWEGEKTKGSLKQGKIFEMLRRHTGKKG